MRATGTELPNLVFSNRRRDFRSVRRTPEGAVELQRAYDGTSGARTGRQGRGPDVRGEVRTSWACGRARSLDRAVTAVPARCWSGRPPARTRSSFVRTAQLLEKITAHAPQQVVVLEFRLADRR